MTQSKDRRTPKESTRPKSDAVHRFRGRAIRRLWRMRTGQLVAFVLLFGVSLVAHPALNAESMLGAFSFHEPGGPPLLLVRGGVLFFALYALRRETPQSAAVGLMFLLSLVAKGALYPFVFVAAGLSSRKLVANRSINTVLYGAVLGAVAFLTLQLSSHPAPLPDERDPQKMVEYWRGRQNLYQARWWAVAWAKREAAKPGDGLLALATLDWELGRKASARKMLTKLLERPGSSAALEAAEAQRAAWDRESPPQEPGAETPPPLPASSSTTTSGAP